MCGVRWWRGTKEEAVVFRNRTLGAEGGWAEAFPGWYLVHCTRMQE